MTDSDSAPSDPARPWLVLTGLALGVTVTNGFARFAYGLLLPAMKQEMGWSYAQAGWLNTANAIGYIVGAVATMLLIRRVGPRRLFLVGLTTTTLALLLTGLSSALWWQTLWRLMAGLLGAMSFATSGTLTAQLFRDDPRRNALAIAILFGSGGGVAIVFAGATLPLMLGHWGSGSWPWGWLAIGAASLCITPLGIWAALQLCDPPQPTGETRSLPVLGMLPELAGYACFGLGYIVYLTFLSAWMTEQARGPGFIALVWVVLGVCLCLSPLVWRPVFARHDSGLPLALVLTGIAAGSALPVIISDGLVLLVSAVVFGLCVFMSPGAITNFARKNLPPESWGRAISLFTVVFAVSQTAGPYVAGWVADVAGSIGVSLLSAAAILLVGAAFAVLQRPLVGRM